MQFLRGTVSVIALSSAASCSKENPTTPGSGANPSGGQSVSLTVPLTLVRVGGVVPTVNAAFARQMSAMGGTGPYSWTVSTGVLPNGLTLSRNGQLTGTPTSTGNYAFSVTVADARGATAGASINGQVVSSGIIPFELGPIPILAYGQSQDVAYQPYVQGGSPPYTFSYSGLPTGVTVDAATGFLSGTVATTGSFDIIPALTDSRGATAASGPSTIMIVAPQAISTATAASRYEGTWLGQFNLQYKVCPAGYDEVLSGGCFFSSQNAPYASRSVGFSVTLKVKAVGSSAGLVLLSISEATLNHPAFACAPCAPVTGMMTLEDPPQNVSTQSGTGLAILVGNPSPSLITNNAVGAMHMGSTGILISNSFSPGIDTTAWEAFGRSTQPFEAMVEPRWGEPAGGFHVVRKSWALVKTSG